MLHTGTMGAVLVYFWPRWKRLLLSPGAAGSHLSATRFVGMVALATAITLVLAYGLKQLIEKVILERMLGHSKGEMEQLFRELPLVGGALFAVGGVILVAGYFERNAVSQSVTPRCAAVIGLIQSLCIPFRGFSRSGATISTALFLGISRQLAEDFSFALAVALTPFAIAWELRRLVLDERFDGNKIPQMLAPGLTGMVLSFVAGLVALRLLSAALERGRWRYFGVYCQVAALVLFVYAYFSSAS
jgi:undecaprenyl-diphosphatase